MIGKRMALFGVICAMLVLGACSIGTPMVFDDSVSPTESVKIYFQDGIEVTSYNGIPVPTKEAPLRISNIKSEWRYVRLPAGEIEFVFDIGQKLDNIYTAKNVPFKYTFEPIEEEEYFYYLSFTPRGGPDHDMWGIVIYKLSNKDMVIKQERRVEFVPFSRPERPILQ